MVGRTDWIDDPRFKTKADRRKNYDDLDAMLGDIFRTKPRQDWLDALLDADVPSAPIYALDEALADPQVQHLGMIREIPHPKVGSVKLVGGGVNLSDTPTTINSPAPLHGEHTDEILARVGMAGAKAGAAE